ncbi:MAG: ATP-dependent ligase [Microbacteriaceae bacterium]|jgi:hypothetical protein|nr:ATP-dependent ligase [Microbacteriaceae bacterium]
MGQLLYGHAARSTHFSDRLLFHLQIVVSTKLRRHESFFLSWQDEAVEGGGRSSVWIDRAIPLQFSFTGGLAEALNREWIDSMTVSAGSPRGLYLTTEPT